MANLSESVKFMEEYLTKASSDTAKLVSSVGTASKDDPAGQARNLVNTKGIESVKASIATNPLAQMGMDTVNQMATTLVQQLVNDALKKVNFSPIQNAVQNFFQAWATISTLDTEVAMELARNTARNMVTLMDQKDQVIRDIQGEITALHNACIIILNSSPFMDQYIRDLISAYGILVGAETKFKNVVRVLEKNHRFHNREFDSGVADLERAQALILPDRGADISSIRAVEDFVSDTIQRQSNKQAVAAAMSIPGISLKLGQKMIEYVRIVTELNLLLNTFLDALDGWIASFSRNTNIDQVTIDHITAGLKQLTDLINGMNSALFPDLSVTPNFDPTQANYGPRLSAQATGWGLKLQAIIEWMKLNPGKGSQVLDQTSNSVTQYLNSKKLLESYGDLSYIGGTMKITQSREDVEVAVRAVARLMLRVNTIVATRQTKSSVTAEFRQVRRYFETSQSHTARMRFALQGFLNTSSGLQGPARQIVGQALGIANKYGLDRVVGLINDGKVRELFGVTPDTATFAGSAVFGMNQLVAAVRGQPTTTDAQIERLENIRDAVEREKKAKEIESNRSYGSTVDAAQEEIKARLAQIKATISPAIEAAKQVDESTGTSENAKAETAMANVIPGFNANRTLAGLQ